ncbi:TonB-dependent receptor [Bacteroidota bacterium]
MKKQIITDPTQKALKLNLNRNIYGTIAEIGAGQEVARRFFRAGGASGTIAKTISAYDMAFSDYLYGASEAKRYVSEERLRQMLETEFDALPQIIKKNKKDVCFFTYADTITAINYQKTNESHGWIGVRFQLYPNSNSNDVIVHIRLLEKDNFLQQRTTGIFGINLIYACYNYTNNPHRFLLSLLDGLSRDQIEINMIKMSGPDLKYIDNRLLSVQLVKNHMTSASLFDKNMNVCQPSDMLHKKNVLIIRGRFRPITHFTFDMINTGFNEFSKKTNDKNNSVTFCELSMESILKTGDFDENDFINRVELICGLGQNVMVSNYPEHYKFISYFNRFKIDKLGIVLNALTLKDILNEKNYKNLKGGILEAFGKLFVKNMEMYVYPALSESGDKIITSKTIDIPDNIKPLFDYLIKNKKLKDLKNINTDKLHIFSDNVIEMIKNNVPGWEEMIPKYAVDKIKSKKMFGFGKSNRLAE